MKKTVYGGYYGTGVGMFLWESIISPAIKKKWKNRCSKSHLINYTVNYATTRGEASPLVTIREEIETFK